MAAKKLFALSLILALGGLVVPAAQGDTMTQTLTVAPQGTNWTETLQVAQLDPTVGTLNSVTISLTGCTLITVQAENISTSSVGRITFSENGTLTVTLVDTSELLLNSAFSASIAQTTLAKYDGTLDYAGTSGLTQTFATAPTNTVVYNTPAALAYFTGTSTTALSAAGTVPDDGFMFSLSGGNWKYKLSTLAGVTVDVTYDYTPVPEPATMGLLLVGGVLVGLRRRNGRK